MFDSPILFIIIFGLPLLFIYIISIKKFQGNIPDEVNAELEKEGVLLFEEHIPMTVRLRNFRAPGRYSSFSIKSGRGSLAITNKRIVSYVGLAHCIIDVPFDHPKITALNISIRKRKKLCISFEASEFNDQQSGRIELRFGLTNIPEAVDVLKQMGMKSELTF